MSMHGHPTATVDIDWRSPDVIVSSAITAKEIVGRVAGQNRSVTRLRDRL